MVKIFNDDIKSAFTGGESVKAIYSQGVKVWPSEQPQTKHLKFTAIGSSTLGLLNAGGNAPILYKSTNGNNWESWDYSTIRLAHGESVYIKGDNPNGFSSSSIKYSYFTMLGSIACGGNVMSLLGEDVIDIPCDYCFYSMFDGCRSLTSAPELPATTLADYCYSNMFYGCSSLTTAPELPATTLTSYCYINMFNGCTSLNYIKAMFTTRPYTEYAGSWVKGVSSTGTFVKNANATWDVTGENGIPSGWTVETTYP